MKYTKDSILNHALKLFNKHGFVNVRLQHIADAGSISVGHLAYHYKNKDAIVEALYDRLKEEQEILLYEFRMAHLFEEINRQLQLIFQLQKKYLFFYVDTLEVLRAYPAIKEKHQQHINWQLQQIVWMFEFNIFRGALKESSADEQYRKLAWLLWITVDNWIYAKLISGADHLQEEDFLQDVWNLMHPYFSDEGKEEFSLLIKKSVLYSR